jgi:TonB family protein
MFGKILGKVLYLCVFPTHTFLVMVQFVRCLVALSLARALALTIWPALAASSARPLPVEARPASLTVTGRVADTKGNPLASVFITMQNASSTATTNSAGNFLLTSEQLNPVLTFKCAGYQTQTFLLKTAGPVTVVLNEIGTVPVAPGAGLEAVNKPMTVADEQPTFPGGATAYRNFLQQNVHYPDAAKAKEVSGDVFVSFIVDEAGRLLDVEVIKGIGYGLDEEALRLVRLMPWWTPARSNGKPIRVPATLRIRFGMQAAPQ